MSDKEIGILLDALCMVCSIITVIYIYRLKRIVGGPTVLLLLIGFFINMSFRVGYLLGHNMHPYFILSYVFVTAGFVSLFQQVCGVIHSPIRVARETFSKAEEVYKRAEEAHQKAGETLLRANEAFDAVGGVNSEIKKIYFTENKKNEP
jgi:hypothetical protein